MSELSAGLWRSNPALVQLLGLCPLLAITTSVAQGAALGFATAIILVASNVLVSLLRNVTPHYARIPVFVMLIASLVTAVELCMAAWFSELYRALGLFIPLIVTNCTILGRAEAFASRSAVLPAAADGLAHGVGFLAALLSLGALRELLGHGSLLRDFDQLFGPGAKDWVLDFSNGVSPLPVALLPPGAFLGLALLVALHQRTRQEDRIEPTNTTDPNETSNESR